MLSFQNWFPALLYVVISIVYFLWAQIRYRRYGAHPWKTASSVLNTHLTIILIAMIISSPSPLLKQIFLNFFWAFSAGLVLKVVCWFKMPHLRHQSKKGGER